MNGLNRDGKDGGVMSSSRQPASDPQARPTHLLTVWNPSYADDAMDAHLRVLLRWAERRDRGEATPDEAYVWWAKLRSPRREGDLPHADDIFALNDQLEAGTETHLYLTDYRSLYVGHLTAISAGDLLSEYPDDIDHMPSYYRGREADFWFYLQDIRRLVDADTPGVIEELKKLHNRRYFDKPVSLYGGIVDLPLLVTREEEMAWFGGNEELTEGRLWAERDALFRGETGRVAQDLRDNLFGPTIWEQLEPASRTFLSTAEAVYRTRREDPGFDFSAPAVEYAKAVETELNALLFTALHRALSGKPPPEREVRAGGGLLDLGNRPPHQSLGTIKYLLDKEPIVTKGLRTVLQHDANWLLGQLPYGLERIKDLRNPAAHEKSLTRSRLAEARAEILGIGQEGLLVRLARAKLRMGG